MTGAVVGDFNWFLVIVTAFGLIIIVTCVGIIRIVLSNFHVFEYGNYNFPDLEDVNRVDVEGQETPEDSSQD